MVVGLSVGSTVNIIGGECEECIKHGPNRVITGRQPIEGLLTDQAYLISAAPELFEALESVLEFGVKDRASLQDLVNRAKGK